MLSSHLFWKRGALIGSAAVVAVGIWYFSVQSPDIPDRPLRIGFESNPPVQIRTEHGYAGLAVETVTEAAKRAGIALEWVETGTSSEEAFRRGLVDLWPLMADLPERRKFVHISKPWLHSLHALVIRSDADFPRRDFTGRISYFRMPLHARLLQEEFPKAQMADVSTGEEAVKTVCTGATSAAFLEQRAAAKALREKPAECNSLELKIHVLPTKGIQSGVASTFEAAAAADTLRREINNLYRDGTLSATMAKYSYYGLDDSWSTYELIGAEERARWLTWGIAGLAIALAFSIRQTLFLRRATRAAEQAKTATTQALSRYELVARATNDALFECDLQTGTITWNEAVSVLFGYPAGSVGSDMSWWEERVHPDDRERVSAGIKSAIANKAPTWSDEYRFRCGDGSYASVVDRGYVLYHDTAPVRLVRSMMDVTARRKLEEQLRQSQKMEAIGRLAGGIAHDFNNLLTVINGYTDLLLKSVDPDTSVRQRLAEIQYAGRRAAELTNQLLVFSRTQLLHNEVLDLNAVIADSAGILRRVIGDDVEFVMNLDPSLRSVRADAGQIHQVLLNLSVNARDAMAAGGKLVLSSSNIEVKDGAAPELREIPPGSYVLMTVTDTGTGMTAEALAHLYEPFFTTKAPGKGTGLGLSIVYGIVRQSNGFIKVTSEEGKGTEVRVFLPGLEASAGPRAVDANPREICGTERVLLVEDQEHVRKLVAVMLKDLGYEVLEAAGAYEALRLGELYDGPIQLLVSDIIMPGMNGCDLASRLRKTRPEMAVVYMSGCADREMIESAMNRPSTVFMSTVFIQKPFAPGDLGAKLRQALHLRPAQINHRRS